VQTFLEFILAACVNETAFTNAGRCYDFENRFLTASRIADSEPDLGRVTGFKETVAGFAWQGARDTCMRGSGVTSKPKSIVVSERLA
jgi:hypothetical protein